MLQHYHLRLLFLLCFFTYLAPVWADSSQQPLIAQKGLLWKISKADVEPSYLLGTIHSDDPRVLKLPAAVETAFTKADSVALEMTLDLANITRSAMAMTFKDDSRLQDFLSADDYRQIINKLEQQGIIEAVANRMKPWAIMVTLSMPKLTSGQFLDVVLYKRAVKAKQSVYGLETVDEQLSIFENISMDEQVDLLNDTLDKIDEIPAFLEKLHQLYVARDLPAMLALYKKDMHDSKADSALLKRLDKAVLSDRNQRMVDRMQARLQEGNAFIGVGALHLPGEQGILALLKQQGYQVQSVY